MEQSLNFEMLRSQWPELAELACMAERYVHSDPESCLVKLRNYTELMVRWLYRQERLPEGIKANLYDLMNADVFTSMMPGNHHHENGCAAYPWQPCRARRTYQS